MFYGKIEALLGLNDKEINELTFSLQMQSGQKL